MSEHMNPFCLKKWTAGLLLCATPGVAQVDPLAPLPETAPRPAPTLPPAPAVPSRRTVDTPVPAPAARGPTVILAPVGPPVATFGATSSQMGFAAYKQQLATRARRAGIREATIGSIVPWLSLNARVIQLDRAQPGQIGNRNSTPPFAPYRREHVTSSLILRGRAVYSANWPQLSALKTRTGVEPSVPVAIFGHETSYGTVTGGFDLIEALATLAYEGRRRELFESEFVAALQLIDRGTPRSRLRGSWAGATGYPQFMPSAVLRLASDGDGDGRADIWTSQADGFASIANFLKDAGWKAGVTWGVAVRTPTGLNRAALRNPVVSARCERVYARHSKWLTMREWRALGVLPLDRTLPDSEPVSLLEPDGPGATAYLLTANYRAILEYNCSNFYALSVGLLADAIAGR